MLLEWTGIEHYGGVANHNSQNSACLNMPYRECFPSVYNQETGTHELKGALPRASLQKFKSVTTHFTATETNKYWNSFDKNYNANVIKLKKSSLIVIPPGARDPKFKKSA